MNFLNVDIPVKNVPELDKGFVPLGLFFKNYQKGAAKPLCIAVERSGGQIGTYETKIYGTPEMEQADAYYVDRLVKFLLWSWGGFKVSICGDDNVAAAIRAAYSEGGSRAFDKGFMEQVYETQFTVEVLPYEKKPAAFQRAQAIGRHTNGARIGFDAGVCQEAMKSRMKDFLNKVGLGKLTYLGIALKQLMRSGRDSAELVIDENSPSAKSIRLPGLMFIACMSHCYEGGGFYFCPGADAADGMLDLCTVSGVPKWKVLLVLPTAFQGKHYRYNGVERYGGQTIHIRTSAPLWVHTDGEVACRSDDITVSCSKQLLRFYY